MASSIPASAPAESAAVTLHEARAGRQARRARWQIAGGVGFVLLVAAVAVAAPWLAPHDPIRQSLRARLAAPTLEAADGKAHLLGTDHLGRDVLSRVIHGARVSLLVGFAAVLVGGAIGSALGIVAGFRGGWADSIIMTLADAQLAFPFILLAIGIIAVLGPSFPTLVVVIGLSGWVSYARILRSQVLSLRSREFVDAVLALGGSVPRIVLRHVLPNKPSRSFKGPKPQVSRPWWEVKHRVWNPLKLSWQVKLKPHDGQEFKPSSPEVVGEEEVCLRLPLGAVEEGVYPPQ